LRVLGFNRSILHVTASTSGIVLSLGNQPLPLFFWHVAPAVAQNRETHVACEVLHELLHHGMLTIRLRHCVSGFVLANDGSHVSG
jgi:cytochrome b561